MQGKLEVSYKIKRRNNEYETYYVEIKDDKGNITRLPGGLEFKHPWSRAFYIIVPDQVRRFLVPNSKKDKIKNKIPFSEYCSSNDYNTLEVSYKTEGSGSKKYYEVRIKTKDGQEIQKNSNKDGPPRHLKEGGEYINIEGEEGKIALYFLRCLKDIKNLKK